MPDPPNVGRPVRWLVGLVALGILAMILAARDEPVSHPHDPQPAGTDERRARQSAAAEASEAIGEAQRVGLISRLDHGEGRYWVDPYAWAALDAQGREGLVRLLMRYRDASRRGVSATVLDARSGRELASGGLGGVRIH